MHATFNCRKIALVASALLCLFAPGASAANQTKLDRIKGIVEHRLAENPSYFAGDLIDAETVEPIFNTLVDLGVKLDGNAKGAEEMFDAFLSSGDYLVIASHMPEGHRFMH